MARVESGPLFRRVLSREARQAISRSGVAGLRAVLARAAEEAVGGAEGIGILACPALITDCSAGKGRVFPAVAANAAVGAGDASLG